MQCERLIKLVKTWFLHVKDETMAPARMVQFIKQHVEECHLCQEDPDIHGEIEKITEIVLPESKIPKAVRLKQEMEEAKQAEEEPVAKEEPVAEEEPEAEAKEEEDSESGEKTKKGDNYSDEEEEVEEPLSPDSTTL